MLSSKFKWIWSKSVGYSRVILFLLCIPLSGCIDLNARLAIRIRRVWFIFWASFPPRIECVPQKCLWCFRVFFESSKKTLSANRFSLVHYSQHRSQHIDRCWFLVLSLNWQRQLEATHVTRNQRPNTGRFWRAEKKTICNEFFGVYFTFSVQIKANISVQFNRNCLKVSIAAKR